MTCSSSAMLAGGQQEEAGLRHQTSGSSPVAGAVPQQPVSTAQVSPEPAPHSASWSHSSTSSTAAGCLGGTGMGGSLTWGQPLRHSSMHLLLKACPRQHVIRSWAPWGTRVLHSLLLPRERSCRV